MEIRQTAETIIRDLDDSSGPSLTYMTTGRVSPCGARHIARCYTVTPFDLAGPLLSQSACTLLLVPTESRHGADGSRTIVFSPVALPAPITAARWMYGPSLSRTVRAFVRLALFSKLSRHSCPVDHSISLNPSLWVSIFQRPGLYCLQCFSPAPCIGDRLGASTVRQCSPGCSSLFLSL